MLRIAATVSKTAKKSFRNLSVGVALASEFDRFSYVGNIKNNMKGVSTMSIQLVPCTDVSVTYADGSCVKVGSFYNIDEMFDAVSKVASDAVFRFQVFYEEREVA